MRAVNLSGQRFGRLIVTDLAGRTSDRGAKWLCICDCGNRRDIAAKNLLSGCTQSCGCLGKERRTEGVKRTKTTHGETAGAKNSRTYRIWTNMVSRCTNPRFDAYPWYGGRGIQVCDHWRKFANFLADMGRAPDGMSIDRCESNGHYEPGNCRWATLVDQSNNRRSNKFIDWRGERLTQAQWSKRLGIDQKLISSRLLRGWPIDRAFGIPLPPHPSEAPFPEVESTT